MPIMEADADAVRRQLDRVLASDGFSRNERLARFLRFAVERHLQGRDGEVKESVIAVEVFGRNPDHDPRHDSIVRTEATRLRARLGEYYLGERKNDALVIELPKGGYTPVFRQIARSPGPVGNVWRPGTGRRNAAAVAIGLVLIAAADYAYRKRAAHSLDLPFAAGETEHATKTETC